MVVDRRKTAAFTLVELLVVISILGVLMALLVPAVNSVRESMRRAQCKNNLHQIGVAMTAHVAKHDCFPSGGWGMRWLGDPDHGTAAEQPGSWIYQLLPFMGLDMIHDITKGVSQSQKSSNGYLLKQAVIPNIICATRRRAVGIPDAITQGAYNSVIQNPATPLNKTDYAACTGSADPTDAFSGPELACLTGPPSAGGFPNCSWDPDATSGNGVVYQASQVAPGQVTNGLGYCFFAGEKSLSPNDTITVGGQSGKIGGYYNGEDPGDDNSAMQGFDHDTVRWCTLGLPPTVDTQGVSTTTNSFGSAHNAGCHFVFCDGSVKMISYQIDMTTYTALGTRNYAALNPSFTFNDNYFIP